MVSVHVKHLQGLHVEEGGWQRFQHIIIEQEFCHMLQPNMHAEEGM